MNQFRRSVNLNGTWDFCPIYGVKSDLSLPAVREYTKITVPSIYRTVGIGYQDFKPLNLFDYPDEWNDAETAVYRRTVSIDADVLDGRHKVFLRSENTAQQAAFYLNGEHVASWDEMFLPLIVDVTPFLRVGDNVLQVVCTSWEKVTIPSGAEKLTALSGSFLWNTARGIWGNISLEILPNEYLSDVTVRTSVRNRTIEIITAAENGNEASEIKAEIKDGDATVLVLTGKVGSMIAQWENPVYWDIENPHLYTARVSLLENGETVDVKEERFGFREIWHEGTQFILNGTPINLRGDSWHFFGTIQMTKEYAKNWYRMCRENGVNYIRLHAQPHPTYYLDAADEEGMLIVDETAIYGSGKSMDAASPQYIENCRKHVRRLVKRDRNHPSVLFWSLQNEMRWVDGRDVYKHYIPSLMGIMREEDPTRAVSLDGDNRLLPYALTELESLHYNIDGTLAQWKREKPLTVGEHGALWYICPQNASAYIGLSAYDDFEPCAIGFSTKERLFQEDARRKGVSGISTFNFAYYFTRSMPDEDVYVENAPFKKIPKYALTINNGYLKDYPVYRENPLMPFMREAYRPVTVINREYNRSFYASSPLVRTFDVYNDTLSAHTSTVFCTLTVGGKTVWKERKVLRQEPGGHDILELTIPSPDVREKTVAKLTLTLSHEEKAVISKDWDYTFYPESIKTDKIPSGSVYFYGDEGFDLVSDLCEHIEKVKDIGQLDGGILFLGAHLDLDANLLAARLDSFVSNGGVLVVLEQSTMGIGNLTLTNLDFFSAHSSNPKHPLLAGLTDDDLIFWGPSVTEDRPEAIIHRNYLKPIGGEYTFVLESASGDYADGGDLWSPLMTVKHGKGTVVLCQLELNENYAAVPQACVLLRNLLSYAASLTENTYLGIGSCGKRADAFLARLGVKASDNDCRVLLADVADCTAEEIKTFLLSGGTVVTLPFGEADLNKLSMITGDKISLIPREISHAKTVAQTGVVENVSYVDLFRYDKVAMSPRQVVNKRLAHFGFKTAHADELIKDVTNTVWEDSFWNRIRQEPCIIPLISMNREVPVEPVSVLSEIKVGQGRLILSQLSCDGDDEKDVNLYTRLLENLGAETRTELFTYVRSDKNDAVDFFMTLPLMPWQNEDDARAYYTDPEYSLNNLGEGLYGWMQKIEKKPKSGTLEVPNSAHRHYFLTCFADKGKEEKVRVRIESELPITFYLNGVVQKESTVTLRQGTNRYCLEVNNDTDRNLSFCMVVTKLDGTPLDDIRHHVTIDEVDPK